MKKGGIVLSLSAMLAMSPAFGVSLVALDTLNNTLHSIDTNNVENPQTIGTINGYDDLSALVAVSPSILYTTDRTTSRLLTIDAIDGSVLNWVSLSADIDVQARGFDLSPGGILFGILPAVSSNIFRSELVTIDPGTGDATSIGETTGAGIVEGLAFSPSGILYAVGSPIVGGASDTLYTVNTLTAELGVIGTLELGGLPISDIDDLTFGPDGFLYGADSETFTTDLLRINPQTAEVNSIGNPGIVGFAGIAAVIPIPAAVWLFVSALGLLGWIQRKSISK